MTSRAHLGTALMALMLAGASSGWAQQYLLYSPSAVNTEQKGDTKDGVLVQEVQVQKGDTLYGISRRFSGHGTYYPQILLFNELKDPNKIYPGKVLKIPVTRKTESEAVPTKTSVKDIPVKTESVESLVKELSTADLKKSVTGREKKREAKKKAEESSKAETAEKTQTIPVTGRYAEKKVVQEKARTAKADSATSQKLFEQAVKAYRQDDYRTALELFDRFLTDNPSSSLAPDASLYKAECYLKQSSQ